MIEKAVAYHCGPTLAGIKPANIVSCYKSENPDIHEEICRLNRQFNAKDIYFEVLFECSKRVLLMVFNGRLLDGRLRDSEVKMLLQTYGYPDGAERTEYIGYLKKRLLEDEFPHEIGAFLGYPVHDIRGFINNRDEGCVLTGEWKVYKNAEDARKMFRRYSSCRRAIMRRMSEGISLAQLFCAV